MLHNHTDRDEYLATGILHMTNAVSFINNDCKMVRRAALQQSVVTSGSAAACSRRVLRSLGDAITSRWPPPAPATPQPRPQIHGNMCMAAVVVTDSLDWKLHGFDLLSEAACTVSGPSATGYISNSHSVSQSVSE